MELTVAFKVSGLNQTQLYFIPACFSSEEWDLTDSIGGTLIGADEIGFKLVTQVPPEGAV